VVVGICRLSLLVSYSHSLKEKRAVVRKIKDRVRHKYSVALSEVGGLDKWQRAVLGYAVVGNDRDHVTRTIGRVSALVESMGIADVTNDEREYLTYGDDEPIGQAEASNADASWIPDEWREEASDG
jgi:hypothetical protein